jgi:hypothetical protein
MPPITPLTFHFADATLRYSPLSDILPAISEFFFFFRRRHFRQHAATPRHFITIFAD